MQGHSRAAAARKDGREDGGKGGSGTRAGGWKESGPGRRRRNPFVFSSLMFSFSSTNPDPKP